MYEEDFHIGLKNTAGAPNCADAAGCDRTLHWVNSAGQAVNPLIGAEITNDMENLGSGNCFFIEGSATYKILDVACSGIDMWYICEFECPVTCPNPVGLPRAVSDWSTGESKDQGVVVQ